MGDTSVDSTPPKNESQVAVSFLTRFTWGIGSLGTISYLNIITALVMVYLTTVLKIEPAIAGTIVFLGRVIDAFCDPLMGWISDRTKTKWGRRRPYLLLGAILCGLSLPLVYSAHLFTGSLSPAIIAFIVLVIYSIGYTVFNVPYLTMPVEMTTDRLERFGIMSYRVIFMMIGGLIGNAGAPWLLEKLGGGAMAFQWIGLIGGAIVFVAMLIPFFGTVNAKATLANESSISFLRQIREVFKNRPFVTLVVVKVLQFFAIAASASTTAFFVTVVLKQGFSLLSVFGLATTVSIMVSIPFWRYLGKFITKRKGFMIGLSGEVLSTLSLLWATPENAYQFFIFRGIVTGFFSSSILLNSQAMWLDTIDYDQQQTGLRREGMYTSIYVFVERLGYSLGPLVLGFLLSYLGFDKNVPLDQQPESANLAIYIGAVWIPVAMYVIGAIVLYFYRLPEVIAGKQKI